MQFVSIGNSRSPLHDCTFGVPQGSVLGPVLFTLFLSPLANVISSFGVDHHQYADNTQLYVSLSLKNAVAQINQLTECTTAVYRWFLANGLALNPSKSESVLMGTVAGTGSLSDFGSVNIADAHVSISDTIKSLGVILDTNLTFRPHVDAVCKSCFFHIRALRHVKNCLLPDLLKIVSTSIVSSRLDYCNSLLLGTTKSNIGRLQRVQNTLARLVTGTKRFDHHIKPVLSDLHWLPVSSRVTFKLALLSRKILSTNQPSYLATMISPYQPPRNLRISTMKKLAVPSLNGFRTAMSRRVFCFATPELWNGLPPDVTDTSVSMAVFRSRLKTHLFRTAFDY